MAESVENFIKEKLLWMIKICKVLNKIHEQGIIHMDLKPENIMLDRSEIYLITILSSIVCGEKLSRYGTKTMHQQTGKDEERADISVLIYIV